MRVRALEVLLGEWSLAAAPDGHPAEGAGEEWLARLGHGLTLRLE